MDSQDPTPSASVNGLEATESAVDETTTTQGHRLPES